MLFARLRSLRSGSQLAGYVAFPLLIEFGCGTQAGAPSPSDSGSGSIDGAVESSTRSQSDGSDGSVDSSGSRSDGSGPEASSSDVAPQASGLAVVTNRYDDVRSGANTTETTLTVANVGGGKFGQLFSHPVDGHMYSQPLYLAGLSINGATHNVVFVTTAHDTVYAFDADSESAVPLWTASLGTPMNAILSTNGENNPLSPGSTVSCANMFPKSGITSTPVIDRSTGRMYVLAKTFDSATGTYASNLHALDVLTGKDAVNPVVIQGAVSGTGVASDGGVITFDPFHALNRPGLLLLDGNIYVAFGSHCDDPPYHGWLFVYSADTLSQKGVMNTTPNGSAGAIWQSGFGVSTDGTDIFFATGNGDFDTANGGAMFGLSVVRAHFGSGGLSVVDWWTAYNAAALNSNDLDLGSGPVLLPNPKVIIVGGKDGYLYVVDPARMGKFTSASNAIIQSFDTGFGEIHGGPVYWNGPSGPTIYVWPQSGPLDSYGFNKNQINTTALSEYLGDTPTLPGGILTLSSNGSTAGTGIVWATFTSGSVDPTTNGDALRDVARGALYAFDATDLTNPIWTSTANKARDDIGFLAKFNPPIVANGKVYLATQGAPSDAAGSKPDGGTLHVYGLLP